MHKSIYESSVINMTLYLFCSSTEFRETNAWRSQRVLLCCSRVINRKRISEIGGLLSEAGEKL